jgi:hypothetical protein
MKKLKKNEKNSNKKECFYYKKEVFCKFFYRFFVDFLLFCYKIVNFKSAKMLAGLKEKYKIELDTARYSS